jgi:iron complex transport system ATP-binding protein
VLEIKNLSVRFGDLTIVENVSFSLRENAWLMLVGPNGAGKSTIINAISQSVAYTGEALYNGADVRRLKPARLARCMGVLTQNHSVAYSFTVGEIVRLGRYAYAPGIFSAADGDAEERVARALEITGMLPFENHSALTLSGGELQRAFLAQVFAQDPKILILDEPANHLDLVYQKQVFELIGEWLKAPGRAVISVVHDLSLARAFGTEVLLLDKGRRVALGAAEEVLTRENLRSVYAMDVHDWMRRLLSQWGA